MAHIEDGDDKKFYQRSSFNIGRVRAKDIAQN